MPYKMPYKKALVTGVWVALLLAAAWFAVRGLEEEAPPVAAAQTYREVVVKDGDSLELDGQRIRLWAIDAPEYKQECRQGKLRRFCGEEAQAVLRGLVGDGMPQCRQKDIDQYDRVVAQCFVDGKDLGAEMVRAGWALAYYQYGGKIYEKAQDEARAAGRGLWAMNFTKPWVWRQREREAGER